MLGSDDANDAAYIFLLPNHGNPDISLLRDRFGNSALRPHLRLDLPYVPHITIGCLASREQVKDLCDDLNQQGVSIEGSLTKLTVGGVEGERFRNLSVHTSTHPWTSNRMKPEHNYCVNPTLNSAAVAGFHSHSCPPRSRRCGQVTQRVRQLNQPSFEP